MSDSLIDAGTALALEAPEGSVTLDRCTVGGRCEVRVVEASEVIFDDTVVVDDRFKGCVRYSRVTSDSVLPHQHHVTTDTPVRYVSLNRHDPAWRRLRADCDPAVRKGAESGTEMGAFGEALMAQRREAFEQRLAEYTPAGLVTGIIRLD